MFAFPLILFGIMMLAFPEVTSTNIPSLFKQSLLPTVLACGLLFNMSCGNWDFAIGSEAILAAIIGGNLAMRLGLGLAGIIAGSVLVGIVCGSLIGLVYYWTKIPTIIVSIGFLFVYECIGALAFGGHGVNISGSGYVVLGTYPWNIIYSFAAIAFAYFLLYRTRFGYQVRFVGSDINIAVTNGVKAYKIKAICLMLSGLFGGLYSAASLCSNGVIAPQTQMGTMTVVFDAMMGCIVGMALSFGKNNLIVSMFVGSLIMQEIKLALLVMGVQTQYVNVFIAVLVLILLTFATNPQIMIKIKKRVSKLMPKRKTDIRI